jgi:hypothetical protein
MENNIKILKDLNKYIREENRDIISAEQHNRDSQAFFRMWQKYKKLIENINSLLYKIIEAAENGKQVEFNNLICSLLLRDEY